jgi:hypothetical protein
VPNSKGEGAMTSGVKGISAAAIFGISYINHIFSPLIWALLALIVVDILLNVHKEGQQLTKIGSAFATLGGTSLISVQHAFTLEAVHGLVAVMVLAYIQVVAPQFVSVINKAKNIAPSAKVDMIAVLQAENEALKQQAEKAQAEVNKVVITTGGTK